MTGFMALTSIRRLLAAGSLMLCALLALTGCCSNVSTDPREGGLAGGVCGKTTGAYDRRLQARESELASLSAAQNSLQSRLSSNRRRASELDISVAARRQGHYADERALDEKISDERAAIDRAKAEKSSIDSEIAELDHELAGLISEADRKAKQLAAIQEGRMAAANKQQVDAQLRSLAQRRAEVQAKIRRLREQLE